MSTIQAKFAGKFVTDYETLISTMPVNENDRHVLAAAVSCKAQIIVTNNLKDFPPHLLFQYKVAALPPDEFLLLLLKNSPEKVQTILTEQAANLRKPSLTVFEVLDRLELEAPHFVRMVRELF